MELARLRRIAFIASALFLVVSGCRGVLGLDDFGVVPPNGDAGEAGAPFVPECLTNAECTDRLTAANLAEPPIPTDGGADGAAADASTTVPAVCVKSVGKCAPLLSPDCYKITGDYLDDDAIVLATLFSTVGAQATTNIPRENSALLAALELNGAGGLPPSVDGGKRRKFTVVSCNETTDLLRVGNHLVNELHVPAIVGPNTSQDVLDLSQKVSVAGGTLLISPASVASSISFLEDKDLTWRLIPSDAARSPLMIQQLNALEVQERAARGKTTLKLAIIYKNDAFGIATYNSLSNMKFNGAALSDSINAGSAAGNVRIDGYDFNLPDQAALIAKYRDFAPDIVALVGTAEAVTKVLVPLEAAWSAGPGTRPHYVLTDSSKVTELLTAVNGKEDLRQRVRGTGVTPQAASSPVFNAFVLSYTSHYGTNPSVSSMGPSYDSMYAVAYGITARGDKPITGAEIAIGFRQLSGGFTVLDVGSQKILLALQKLAAGEKITALGTFAPLEWDSRGDVVGTIEMWCIRSGTPAYASSGLTYSTQTQQFTGTYQPCN